MDPHLIARDERPWLTWSPILPVAFALIDSGHRLPVPRVAWMLLFVALLAINGVRFFPPKDAPVRRRMGLAWLVLLAPASALVGGPFGPLGRDWAVAHASAVHLAQNVSLTLAVAVPLVLAFLLPGARRFVILTGLIALLVVVAIAGGGEIVVDQNS